MVCAFHFPSVKSCTRTGILLSVLTYSDVHIELINIFKYFDICVSFDVGVDFKVLANIRWAPVAYAELVMVMR